MKILVDENLPRSIVDSAQSKEIESAWVRDEMPGAPDSEILNRLGTSGETLITRDIRFANHVLEQIAAGAPLGGVILIREQRMADLRKAWQRFLEHPRAPRGIAVVTKAGIRFREPPIDPKQT